MESALYSSEVSCGSEAATPLGVFGVKGEEKCNAMNSKCNKQTAAKTG